MRHCSASRITAEKLALFRVNQFKSLEFALAHVLLQ